MVTLKSCDVCKAVADEIGSLTLYRPHITFESLLNGNESNAEIALQAISERHKTYDLCKDCSEHIDSWLTNLIKSMKTDGV